LHPVYAVEISGMIEDFPQWRAALAFFGCADRQSPPVQSNVVTITEPGVVETALQWCGTGHRLTLAVTQLSAVPTWASVSCAMTFPQGAAWQTVQLQNHLNRAAFSS